MEQAEKLPGNPISWKRTKMLSACLFLIWISISQIESAIIYRDQVEKPGHEGQCYDRGEKIFYNKGDILKNEENVCCQSNCLGPVSGTGKVRIEILTCPKVEAGVGCRVVQDPTKPYPQCCPRLVSDPPDQKDVCQKQAAE